MNRMIKNDSRPPSSTSLNYEQSYPPRTFNNIAPPLLNQNHLNIQHVRISPCPVCHQRVNVLQVREVSGAQIFWGSLLLCTLPIICWLPFCVSRCDDKRLECQNCMYIYDYYQSPLCPYF